MAVVTPGRLAAGEGVGAVGGAGGGAEVVPGAGGVYAEEDDLSAREGCHLRLLTCQRGQTVC